VDGRKRAGALLIVVAIAMTACQSFAPLSILGVLGEFSGTAPVEPAEQRPPLRKVFGDGRYVFRHAPRPMQRAADREFAATGASADLDRVTVELVFERGSETTQMLAFGIVWKEGTVAGAFEWNAFVAGYENGLEGVELARGSLRGADVAFGTQPDATVVLVNYAPDLTLMVTGPPGRPLRPLKDVARYLLRAR
jgi:hypothetical protein